CCASGVRCATRISTPTRRTPRRRGAAGATSNNAVTTAPRPPPFSGRTAWARNLETPLRSFLRTETGSAAVLLAAAVAALVWANADVASYERVWTTTFSVTLGAHGISHDLRYWLNSGLMTLFFFVVGLEARRE